MNRAVRLAYTISVIVFTGLTGCVTPAPGPTRSSPLNTTIQPVVVKGNYTCQTDAVTGNKNCISVFTFPADYVFCFLDPRVTGGCGSSLSSIQIEVVSNSRPTDPPWHNYFTYNFNQYNASLGGATPFVSFFLMDQSNQKQPPALAVELDSGTCRTTPPAVGKRPLPDALDFQFLPTLVGPFPGNVVPGLPC